MPAEHRVSLGEGWTPMLPLDWSGRRVHFKLEWFNPTSSFKDRGVAVMVSHLRGLGRHSGARGQLGNGGSAVAAYAAAAGIQAKIIVPAETSAAKILQTRAFGAEIELVPGTRDEVAEEAVRQSASIPYASHNWHPMFLQGTKTVAYEMWEMLGFTAPDNVVLVAGAGSNILGCDIAFTELLAAGQITRRPRLLSASQSTGPRLPTLQRYRPRRTRTKDSDHRGGSIDRQPLRLPETVSRDPPLRWGRRAVSEERSDVAVRDLAARGLYAEPTSSVAAAALDRFIADGTIRPGQTTVVVLTGGGLKSAEKMAAVFAEDQAQR